MRILGIETSCDDTGIGLLEIKGTRKPSFRILSNIVSSQVKIHRAYGGVYPSLAKREHEKNLPIVLEKVLKTASISPQHTTIDAIAFTVGPGLSPCLWAGINFVKKLREKWKVPLIPVDHIEAHLIISLFSQRNGKFNFQIPNQKKVFPAVALIVSGGHTQLVFAQNFGKYKIIGETRDDAAGEAFDKTARILGLGFPGGPAIAAAAAKLKVKDEKLNIKLPRPMIHTKDYDLSFSGLKTAVLYDYQSRSPKVRKSKEYIQAMAGEIQQAIVDVLIAKTLKAAGDFRAKTIILGGGVAANEELRRQMKGKVQSEKLNVSVLAASPELCTDNGTMIALAGYFHWKKGTHMKMSTNIEAQPNRRIG